MPEPSLVLQRLALPDVAPVGPGAASPVDAAARGSLYWRGAGATTDGSLAGPATLDLGTWFNAAPTGWWARLGVGTVRLTVRGEGAVTLHASTGGERHVLARGVVAPDRPWTHAVEPGGADWCWLDVAPGGGAAARVDDVAWETDVPPTPVRPLTVVVPTFRLEDAALAQLARLTRPGLDGVVGHVVLVDQGGTLAGRPGTAEALAAAGGRVLFVEQPNLGGSGGYSRGLLEAARRWPDDPVLLHDDDAETVPEVLRRLQALAAAAPGTLVGTALLSAEEPTSLQALAEGVEPRAFRWGPTDGVGDGIDLGAASPDGWTGLEPAARADYGGWWGCLVPAGAVDRIGLAAPYFLKWDDAEYGLRARRAGLRVASVPGVSVWHPTWAAKGTISSWSAWPLHRNRIATAAAYGAGRGVLLDSFVHQVKHVLSLQYATAALWDAGIAEVLAGPGWLAADLTAVRPRAQALLDGLPPAPAADADRAPAAAHRLRPAVGALRAVAGLVRPASPRSTVTLEAPHAFTWSDGLGRDEVVFDDGTPPLVRDPRRARRALVSTVRLHWRALRSWGSLRRAYGRSLRDSASVAAWEERFGGVHRDD